jgi:hypothetical protein
MRVSQRTTAERCHVVRVGEGVAQGHRRVGGRDERAVVDLLGAHEGGQEDGRGRGYVGRPRIAGGELRQARRGPGKALVEAVLEAVGNCREAEHDGRPLGPRQRDALQQLAPIGQRRLISEGGRRQRLEPDQVELERAVASRPEASHGV